MELRGLDDGLLDYHMVNDYKIKIGFDNWGWFIVESCKLKDDMILNDEVDIIPLVVPPLVSDASVPSTKSCPSRHFMLQYKREMLSVELRSQDLS